MIGGETEQSSARGNNMKATTVERDSAGVITHPPVILLATFLVGLVLHLAFSVMLLPEGWALEPVVDDALAAEDTRRRQRTDQRVVPDPASRGDRLPHALDEPLEPVEPP